jgi:integrase
MMSNDIATLHGFNFEPVVMSAPRQSEEKKERLNKLFENSNAENTKLTYTKQLRYFEEWCRAKGIQYGANCIVTPDVLVDHLEDLFTEGKRLDTIKARVRVIAAFHKWQAEAFRKLGKEIPPSPTASPIVTNLLKGIRVSIADKKQQGDTAQAKAKALCMWQEDLYRLCQAITEPKVLTSSRAQKRALALVLVGWAGAFRRSELVAIKKSHLKPTAWGYIVTVPKTKTGNEYTKQLKREDSSAPWCPVRALEEWLEMVGNESEYVFPSFHKNGRFRNSHVPDKLVETIVGTYAEEAKLRPGKWSAHSLRRGYASQHLAWSVEEQQVRRQMGMTATSPVLHEYVEEATDYKTTRSSVSGKLVK